MPGWLVLQGDARAIPLRDESVPLVIADPPFNVGKKYGPHYDDRKPAEEYWGWLGECLAEIARVMMPASTLYIFHTDMGAYRLKPLGEASGAWTSARWRRQTVRGGAVSSSSPSWLML